ncbi:MAG: hypothetical protein AABX48_02570 [Nanoarchaeota archaeon]
MDSKRGQTNSIGQAVGVIFGIFIIAVVILTVVNINQGVGSALKTAFNDISDFSIGVLGPFFGFILNFGSDTNTNFLMVLSFVLISIIVVGTLDSVNIFGDSVEQAGIINLIIGIIVSIIGVRFMPTDIWVSLTAPSSAFVATILVGAPFAALFFVTMKIKYPLARKLLWLFYLIFMSYLIVFPSGGASLSNKFMWIYVVFLILAGVMLFFDSTVRRYMRLEKTRREEEEILSTTSTLRMGKLRRDLEDAYIALSNAPDANARRDAQKTIKDIKASMKALSSA